MKYKGITYDVGTEYSPNVLTCDSLSLDTLKYDMNAVKNDLNCNSIRIYGKDAARLLTAAEIALETGLHVWLSPRLIDHNIEDTLTYLQEIAFGFEKLKSRYPQQELIFIVGGEMTIDMTGFVKGNTIHERIQNLAKPIFFLKNALGIKPAFQKQFSQFLTDASSVVRKHFTGKITYASAMWENIDWTLFDFVANNLYKANFNKSFFNRILKKMNSKGLPLAITEFGCCTYVGADEKGPAGYFVLDTSTVPPIFKGKCDRSEKVQADYILDLLETFDKEQVEATFIFDFYSQKLPYSTNTDLDYDKASFSVTKAIGNGWEPKESFYAIAEFYKNN